MTDWNALLNPEQCAAVTAGDGPLLVLAAAGTGKTRTLTYRVAYLIEHGIDPHEILLLTFTNRAAREMLVRAEQLVGPAIANLWSGTFHHVCNRILRVHAPSLGFTRSFIILDRDDSLSLLNRCIKDTVADVKHFPKKEVIASLIGKVANTQGDLLSELEGVTYKEPINPADVEIIAKKYAERKRAANAMDFDDLLVFTLRLFKEFPEILRQYTNRFRYVLVDEYQDTNTIQSQLVDLLASGSRNIMAVGDDFQCIYSWRGADFRNIMDFPKRWDGCKIIKLERNYRSTPNILSVANACIAGNPEQFQKTLIATRSEERNPVVAYLRDAPEQSQMVHRHIQRAFQAGYKPEEIAVLYRSHFHAMELEMDLRRQGINYVITSGVGIFESAHVKDTVSFLRMCSGGSDSFAFTRVMGLLQGVGEKTAEKIWGRLGGQFDSSQETERLKLLSLIPKKALEDWKILDSLFAKYHAENLEENGNKAVCLFLDSWYEAYLLRSYDNGEDRSEDVAELAAQFKKGERVGEFLYDVALMTNVDAESAQAVKDRPSIHLSTVHQAKGLEWPVVIILWCDEEMFPSGKALREGNDSEERRLFYVAVTRAKNELLLCVPARRQLAGNSGPIFLAPSRFVREIPSDLVSKHYGMY
ncbi:MAG: ATP-dependent helicase [Kiritimatiellia bacterium]